jgi:tetracycline resistance efflux pump
MEYGFLSILPPLLAIVLAIATRQVIVSLFLAVWLGASFLHGSPVAGFFRSIDTYMLESAADPWYAAILIFTMIIAGYPGPRYKGRRCAGYC